MKKNTLSTMLFILAIGARQMLTVESVVVTIYNKVQAGYLFCGAECAIL